MMEIIDQLKYARALTVLQNRFEDRGLALDLGRNFNDFRDIVAGISDRNLSDQFDLRHEKLLEPSSFWVVLRDRADGVVGVHAAKFDDIGQRTLDAHWRVDQPRMYRENAGCDIEYEEIQSRAAQSISGRVAYIGDLWIREDFRKTGTAPDLVKLVQIIAMQIWSPETIYAFIHDVGVLGGLAATFGFCHQHQLGIRWRTNPRQCLRNNWLVYNRRDDLLDLIDILAENLE